MRFSVDAHAIGCHLTGNEVYVRSLLEAFAAVDDNSEFVAYVSTPEAARAVPRGFATRTVSRNPFARLGRDLPRQLRRDRPDLIHVQYTAPVACPAPIVVSVHDVSFLEHPEYFTFFRTQQLRTTVRRTVKRAARILTPSDFSKRSILNAYDLPDDKVVVLPNAVSNAFRPISRELAQRRVFLMLGVPKPIILTVGDVQPRKNHLNLIKAFEELLQAHPQLPHHLVIVGKETWYSPVVKSAVARSSAAQRIHFTGFVSDDELLQLYGACDMFVYPSFYEGFGLPILEAMACHRAVACSNTSAMPEVADSSALLFDPYSAPEIVRAMADLLLDAELRARMERLGAQRAAMFSWERSAGRTLDVYYEVANPARVRQAVRAAAVSLPR